MAENVTTKEGDNGNAPQTDQSSNSGDSSGEGNSGNPPAPIADDSLRAMIREEIANALKDHKPVKSGESGARLVERAAREAVEAEAARVFKEKAHEDAHSKLAVKPPEPEKMPGKGKFLTRLLWGDPE